MPRGPIDANPVEFQGGFMTVQADEPLRRPIELGALNLPNILTYGRIAAAPLVGLTYYIPDNWGPWIAFVIFVWRASLTISMAISPAYGSSNRRSAACSIRSPTSCSSPSPF